MRTGQSFRAGKELKKIKKAYLIPPMSTIVSSNPADGDFNLN